jgi:membrane associated rhomboid family serine protease
MAQINLPPLTRSLLAAVVAFTILNFVQRPQLITAGNGIPYLAIVPGKSIIYPWVFALATVVEQNLLGLIATGLTVFYGGRYLERAWGSQEFIKFIVFVAIIPNIMSFLLYIAAYFITGYTAAL